MFRIDEVPSSQILADTAFSLERSKKSVCTRLRESCFMGEVYMKRTLLPGAILSFFFQCVAKWLRERNGYGSATSLIIFLKGIHPPDFKEDDLRQESLTLM